VRLLLDEDSQSKLLVRLLREGGHEVQTIHEAGMDACRDAEVLAYARQGRRVLLTRNVRDFLDLHEANADHPGVLVEFQDKDPVKNMAATDIVRALRNLEHSGWNLAGQFVALNAWNFASPGDEAGE
jgi:predicted nuclease of predicted toxin-antitoxin system